jgi:hypothetical protein
VQAEFGAEVGDGDVGVIVVDGGTGVGYGVGVDVGNVGDGDGSAEHRQGVPSHGHISSGSSMQTARQSSSVGCSPTPGAAVQIAVTGAELGASVGESIGVGYGVGIGVGYGVGIGVAGTGVVGINVGNNVPEQAAVQVESALQ